MHWERDGAYAYRRARLKLIFPSGNTGCAGCAGMQPSQDNAAEELPARPWHRPLVPVLIGFAVGIVLDDRLGWPLYIWCALGCVVFAGAIGVVVRGSGRRVCWVIAALLLVPLGGAAHSYSLARPPWHLAKLLDDERILCRVRGTVASGPAQRRWGRPFRDPAATPLESWTFRLRVRGLSPDGEGWLRASGAITVWSPDQARGLRVGDKVAFAAWVRGHGPPSNPGETRLRPGAHGTATVASAAAIRVVRRADWRTTPGRLVARLREHLKDRLIRNAPRPIDPLTGALIFGERGRLGTETRELLSESGCVHFLAISGLHVGILAAFVWVLLLRFRMPVRARLVVLIASVWLYAGFTGLHTAALRAALMLTLAAAAPLLGRRSDAVSGLAGAALIILIASPQQLFSVGFQLSFLAVWAIFYLYLALASILWPWEDLLRRLEAPAERTVAADLSRYVRHYLLLSACIWVAVAPVTAYHFNRLSLLAPLLNLIIWPLVLLLTLSSFLLAVSAFLGGLLTGVFVALGGFLSGCIEDVLRAGSMLPGFVLHGAGPPLWWVTGFYAVLSVWVLRTRVRGARVLWARVLFLAGVVALGGGYLGMEAAGRRTDRLNVVVADVGHGQCVVLRLPSGPVILYDAGAVSWRSAEAVAEILWDARARRVQVLAVSHRDFDHCSFIPYLARRFRIERVVIPPRAAPQPELHLDEALRRLDLGRTLMREGDVIGGDGLECLALHPNDRFLGELTKKYKDNERSLVLLCKYGPWRMLLTGDAQVHALRRLAADYGPSVDVDVLLLPHHGAWADGLREAIEAFRPRVAIASCEGPVNEKTEELLRRMGVPLWTTAAHGAMTMELSDTSLTLTGYRSGASMRLTPRDAPPRPDAMPTSPRQREAPP